MVIDFHTHLFPPAIRADRNRFFIGEPAFAQLYAAAKARLVGADQLVSQMDIQGVDRSVVFGFPWKSIDTVRQHNDYILEAVQRHPHRLTGFCCVDPFHPEAEGEVLRCLAAGASGVGELAVYDRGLDHATLVRFDPLMAACREWHLPVLIHTNEPVGHQYPGKSPMTLGQIYQLVCRFPENKIVLAHWGGGLLFYHLMKRDLKTALSNVWVDTAASPYLYDPRMYKIAIDVIGAEKILFGSDYPLLPPERYFREMREGGVVDAELERIAGNNAAALLALG